MMIRHWIYPEQYSVSNLKENILILLRKVSYKCLLGLVSYSITSVVYSCFGLDFLFIIKNDIMKSPMIIV